MKKIILIVCVATLGLFFLRTCDKYMPYKDGYIHDIRIGRTIVAPSYVIDSLSNTEYLAVSRLKVENYRCQLINHKGDTVYTNNFLLTDEIEYRLIDLSNKEIYITSTRSDYIKKLESKFVLDLLTRSDSTKALFNNTKNLKSSFDRHNQDMLKKIKSGDCKFISIE